MNVELNLRVLGAQDPALACELEADEDEARWDERLKKVAAHKPALESEQPE